MRYKNISSIVVIVAFLSIIPYLCYARPRTPARRMTPAVVGDNNGYQTTIYYTPLQAGFVAAAGFNMADTKDVVINGVTYTYQHQFQMEAKTEGFGHLTNGSYLIYDEHGNASFGPGPVVGSANNPLSDRTQDNTSCAANPGCLKRNSQVRVLSDAVMAAWGKNTFKVDDVGAQINDKHLDLYWGEANPRSATNYSAPAGTTYQGENNLTVVLIAAP